MPLFRPEAEQARAGAWLGRILLVRPMSFSVLTMAALGIALALAALFLLGEYTRKARVTGVLTPIQGVMKVIAPQPGTVQEIHVSEGQAIPGGGPLLRLGDARASRTQEDVSATISMKLAERRRALLDHREFVLAAMRTEEGGLRERRSALIREIAQLDREIAAHADRAMLARGSVARARELQRIGFLSAAALDRESETALDSESRLESARRTRLALAREIAAVEFEVEASRSKGHAQLAGLDMQRAAIDQERIERELQFHAAIVAPASGTVATLLVERGQMVMAGAALATVIPLDAKLEAHLFAPSRSIGFVKPGQEVLLRYLAFPHQKFGMQSARVNAVSRNPMSPGELGFVPADGAREPLYRIKVAIDSQTIGAYGRQEPLQAGMQVEADILLDRRRLIEWIFEPLLSLAGRA
jgi:membrane fusion protein